jgi:multiple sugar transport system substrate-binding protein
VAGWKRPLRVRARLEDSKPLSGLIDRRRLLAGAGAAWVAAGLGARIAQADDATVAGTKSARPVQLRCWFMGHEAEFVAPLLPEFERRNPGITVAIQQVPWTAAHEKLLTAFAADGLPDLCNLGNTWIPEFAALNALEPLDAYIAASQVVAPLDYFPGIWDTNRMDGAVLGIPWYVDTRLLFYRRDLLAQAGFDPPPSTWNEWARMLAAVKTNAGPGRYATLLPLNEFPPLLALALQQAEPLLRDGGRRGNFSNDGFRRTLSFYVEMFRRGWAPMLTYSQIPNPWAEFGRGFFTFYISGPWNIEEFQHRLPAELSHAWTTAPLPGPDGPGASSAGGTSLVIFRFARHKDAVWRLIEYLSEPATQIRFHQLTGDLPPRRSAWRDPQLSANEYAKAFREQLERVKPTPKVPEWENIVNQMQEMAAQVVAGRFSVDAGTQELDRRVDATLEKRRWMLDRRHTV